jgi:steroid delta-isomerase-like uncharacterized protein
VRRLLFAVALVVLCGATSACQDRTTRTDLERFTAQAAVEQQNKEVMQASFQAWNERRSDYFLQITTPDYAYYDPSSNPTPSSREDAVEVMQTFEQAFPDVMWRIEDMVAEGDRLTTRFVGHGTHTGDFMGIPPTGNPIRVSGIIISRFEDGKLVEEWEEVDMMGLMEQLGMALVPKSSSR